MLTSSFLIGGDDTVLQINDRPGSEVENILAPV